MTDAPPVPGHVAIVMDGNGRWAAKRLMPHTAGHRAGALTLKKLAPEAESMGVKVMTVYALSTENWKRPPSEIAGLLRLMDEYIDEYIRDTKKNDMRISVVGGIERLDAALQNKINHLQTLTQHKPGLHVNIAINYGGRDEITRAARVLARQSVEGIISPENIDEETFAAHLYTAGLPYPDLLIKAGGEYRISNFLLWQLAYTEIYFTDTLWPDFSPQELQQAIQWFNGRKRRFGARN
jgi:undecaprenyl diphosphate synthase